MRRRSTPLAVCALCALLGGVRRSSAQSTSPTHKHVVSDPAAKELNDLLDAAQAALEKQDFEAAAKNYQDYLAKKPDDAIVHYDLGYIDSALKRPDDAKAEYQRAIELDPKMAAAYLNLGVVLMTTDPAAAIDPLEKAVDLNPADARTKWVLGT